MILIKRYITIFLLIVLCGIWAFSQNEEKPEVIYVPYADTISQELVDYIRSRTKPYILSYHYDMRHLIPEMRCRIQRSKRIGIFSVDKDKQVSFSQGNLQYHRKHYEWRFANNQYDYIGAENIKDGQLADIIDLFGWSGKESKAPFGVGTSVNNADYAGEFLDWGTNEIQGDAPNTWRTLTKEEWEYLLEKRANAIDLYGVAQVEGNNGIVILPDNWVSPNGITFKSGLYSTQVTDYSIYQTFSAKQWALMEEAGAVFLHASGYRDDINVEKCETSGYYWSSTNKDKNSAFRLYFYSYFLGTKDYHSKYRGRSVRLVHDTILPPPAPCETFEVNGVKFNMMCVEGAKFLIGQTEVTQGLWNEVMGHNNSFFKGDDLPVEKVSWDECQLFIQKLNDIVGLRFRLPTESEWEFAAKGGNSSRGYTYSGSNYIDCVAWYAGNSEQKTHPVASLRPNELGIYDMSGNVWEWCQDNYISETQRVVRGGSFFDAVSVCRISSRTGRESDYRSYIGLRLVLDVHEYVDLGLSVMWATTNVGATTPEQYGDYFAWGEVEPKEKYDWTTYSYCNGTSTTLTKYCNKSGYGDNGFTDDKILLDIEDDVAHTIWGGAWRIPSKEEASELIEKCSWTWTQCNGIYGHKVTGVNGNSIFLPAASYKGSGPSYSIGEYGLYWLNELNTTSNHFADLLFLGADNTLNVGNSGTRCFGFAVRPVYPILPPAPCETFEVNGVTFNMMCVEGGTFTMGKDKDAHQVTLSDYYIGETEVTQGLWKAVMGNVPDDQEYYGDEYPVAQITLADCRLFAERLSQITGRHFRVPTEAEWEYAARGGNRSRGYLYAGSNNIDEVAWYEENKTDYQPNPVKQLKPNELGTYDMSGNLAEWVSDWYAPYNKYPQTNPTGAAEPAELGYRNNYRGGCWTFTKDKCESTFRHRFTNRGANGIGLRLVMSDVEPFRAVYINDTTRFYLRPVEGGTFRMGVGAENYVEREGQYDHKDSTTHLVTLSSYHMTETAVTQGLWRAVMGTDIKDVVASSHYPDNKVKQGDAIPMAYVRLRDAIDFIDRLNALTGLQFRLPTEAEFEYAARGGQQSHGYKYPGSNHADSVASAYESDVAKKMPNELGIYDLTGCIREMCTDIWKDKYIYDSHVVNPVGPIQTSGNRVMRGGVHHGRPTALYDRTAYTTSWGGANLGFRLVLPEEQQRKMVYVYDRFFEMVYVKGGSFMMGAADEDTDAEADERPQHQVTLSDYYIGQIEVTQQLWKTVMNTDPSQTKGNYLPVEQVTWDECQEFVARLSQLTGQNFRLPTEAEWEYAARGGNRSRGYRFAGGNGIDSVAWYEGNSSGKTHNVGTKLPNELGIYDMSGNVYEKCQDWYGPYTAEAQVNPQGPAEPQTHRVVRGGCSGSQATNTSERVCRVINRGYAKTTSRESITGLRLVLDTAEYIPAPEPGRRIGVFSVAKDKQVSFSQGNLQYIQSANLWRFAENQYDYIGEDNMMDGMLAERIDLFGWSANNTTAPFGVSTSTNNADYAGEFVDWGTNIIQGDAANTWRTLSKEEWEYLIKGRKNASNLRAAAQVNGVNGMILLPDDWECPEAIDFKAGYHTSKGGEYYAEYQQFTKEQWRELETTGAIFLPAAGMHDGNGIADIQAGGYYWSATDNGDTYAYTLISQSSGAYLTYDNRYDVRSVRLVHDTIVPPPAPCEIFEVNGVTFNMMCVEGGTFTMGKDKDAHQVTLSDYYIGETEVTQGLWKAVMGSIPDGQEYEGDEYPVAFVSLADCRVFVERLCQMTGKFFRIPTEAEWEYAARGGKHSKGYTFAGSDSIGEVAWYKDNMTEYQPHAVKQLKPNELGTYDMTGNLAEWVSDWHAPYNKYPQINPTGPAVPANPNYPCHYRGGCWTYTAEHSETTCRHGYYNRGVNGIGLRLVMSDEEPFRAVYLNDTTRFYLRPVKKGTFMMGSREDDPIVNQNLAAKADELPQHKVILDSDYWVAEYELTQALWTAVMGTDIYDMQAALTKPCSGPVPAGPSYPMYFVYTKDVLEFTRRLSQMTGLNFRLPTEAEWEFAARGGNLTHGYLYAGSNNVDSVAWYTGSNSGIQTVGQKMPNELGLYDLSGNVLERCIDYLEYHQSYNPNDSINPRGRLLQSGNRAYRGGAHNMHKDSVRVTHRAPQTPTYTSQNVGTRLVVNDEHHFQTFNVGSVWFDMIFVKGGTFQMGATEEQGSEAAANEFPVHEVTLSDYYIGQIEVTQRLWQTVMGSSNNPSTIKDSNKPVNNVTWEDCQLFIEKLNAMTGYKFRLPTEAEWEYAARGGHKSKGYKYSGSNTIDDVAWYIDNSGGTTHTFATKQPNELGIYDMSGNVWEWCYDWYGPYSAEAQVDPTGPETGEYHMYRGGGWSYMAEDCRVTRRRQTASYDQKALGFRIVLEVNGYVYYYGLTDEQFESATSAWNMPNRGWGIADQTPIQGRILSGIRLKVHTPGVLHIYKVPSLTESTEENFVKVATISTSTTGLQNIDFAQPFYLGKDEYLVISSPSDEKGLVGYFSASETTLQPFYNHIGQSGGQQYSQSLMVDFY